MHLLSSGHGLHRSHLSHLANLFCFSPQYSSSTLAVFTAKFHHPCRISFIGVRSSPHRLNRRTEWRNWGVLKFSSGVAVGEEKEELEGGEIGGEKEKKEKEKEKEKEKAPHVAVLLKEVVSQFEGRQVRSFVDCTLGAAGHASSILREHPELQTFIGLDVDPVAHKEAKTRLRTWTSSTTGLHLVCTNFRNIKNVVQDVDLGLEHQGVDGILMDLGMSSMQVNTAERGFSFMKDGPADMRMDPSASLTAGEILNKWPEAEVARILRDYGEERRWRHLAHKIVEQRLAGGIHTTAELVELIGGSTFGRPGRGKVVHPATRTFQALRIAVNDELRTLELALADAYALLSPKGRLAVISFHSLEDRIVKHFFLRAAGLSRAFVDDEVDTDFAMAPEYLHIPGETRHSKYTRKKSLNKDSTDSYLRDRNVLEGRTGVILTKRPIVAEADEINTNPRSRSAKLRVIEKP